MQKVSQILLSFDPTKDKYISREYQSFGIHIAEELDDYKHKALYIKLAKNLHRSVLEKALTFCTDSKADNKGALFMWKLTEMGAFKKKQDARSKNQGKKAVTDSLLFDS